MSDTPETYEAVERWRQGKINVFDEMARMERERDEARAWSARWKSAAKDWRRFLCDFWMRKRVLAQERDEARRLLAAAKESLNAIHVEVGGWIRATIEGGDK